MCNCVDVRPGSYTNQDVLQYPAHMNAENGFVRHQSAGVDKCIAEEIKHLWSLGISTVESCCGHNFAQGYICVKHKEDEKKMRELGYEKHFNNLWPDRTDEFNPKSC